MMSKRGWFGAWAAVSALWVVYWLGMTHSLGVDALQEMIAAIPGPILVGVLCLFLPAALLAAGVMVGWLAGSGKGRP